MTAVVDLNTRILSRDHTVYLARPGEGSRLYEEFLEAKLIGPELPEVSFASPEEISALTNVDDQLKRAMAIRRWRVEGRIAGKEPPLDLQSYADTRRPAGYAQFQGMLKGYFDTAKKGDLFVMWQNGPLGMATVGEFTTRPRKTTPLPSARYSGFNLPTRRFAIRAQIQRRHLPSEIIDIITKPNAFVISPRSLNRFFYDIAFSDYLFEGDYRIALRVGSESYNISDDLRLLAFIKYISINTKNVILDGAKKSVPYEKSIFENLGDFAPELQANINSPGFLGLKSPYITPMVISVMVALAVTLGPEALEAAENGKIVIGNSLAPADDPCTIAVSEAVLQQLKLFGIDDWQKACEEARKVSQDVDLKGNTTVNLNMNGEKKQ